MPRSIKTILVATDGSSHAEKAVALAADLAGKYDAKLLLVHVLLRGELAESLARMAEAEHLVDPRGGELDKAVAAIPEGRFPASFIAPSKREATPYQVLRAVGEKILESAEAEAREHGAKRTETRIEDGDPVKRILAAAAESKADLLVTGARGLSDIKALVVGSVSHKLAHLAPMTCICVR
jgi:nucleotide-binding universal stress UspA family protein